MTEEKYKIVWITVVVIAILFIVAAYGYFTGAWETPPS